MINSMVADTANHTPGTFQQNSGFRLNGFPAMGSWLSYGLGSGVGRPARLRRDPRRPRVPRRRGDQLVQRLPPQPATRGWSSAQGGRRSTTSSPPERSPPGADPGGTREFLAEMNGQATSPRARGRTPSPPASRATSWRARMQTSVPLVTDLDGGARAETLSTLWRRPPRDRRLRQGLPDRPATPGAWRPVRPAPLRRHVQQPQAELGRPREHEGQPRPGGPADRPARRRA